MDLNMLVIVAMAASVFELISASLVCQNVTCSGLEAYGISVGIVSIVLLVPIALVLFAEPLAPARLPEGLPHLSLLLLVWWIPAWFLLTFVGPFDGLSNGYFAVHVGAAAALQICRAQVSAVDIALRELFEVAQNAPRDRPVLCALALTSTAMWVEAAIHVAALPNEHTAVKTWAIIVGVVSSVMCAFYLLLEKISLHQSAFATILAFWWCQGIAISFVPSSFMRTCNGFLTTWLSVGLALYHLRLTRGTHDLEPVATSEPDDPGFSGPTTSYSCGNAGSGGGLGEDRSGSAPSLQKGPPPVAEFRHTGGMTEAA
jgi:hypothetical protein